MKRRWLPAALLWYGWLVGCGFYGAVLDAQSYRLTLYAMPRIWRLGVMQLGLRVQDRDYRIQDQARGKLACVELATGQSQIVALHPGPGRDLRARIALVRPGRYRLDFQIAVSAGDTVTAQYLFEVPRD